MKLLTTNVSLPLYKEIRSHKSTHICAYIHTQTISIFCTDDYSKYLTYLHYVMFAYNNCTFAIEVLPVSYSNEFVCEYITIDRCCFIVSSV